MMYTPEQIDAALTSNFDGSDEIEMIEKYDGSQDDDIESFTGVGLDELQNSTQRFTISFVNTLNVQKNIVLTPGKHRVDRAALVVDDGGTPKYKVPGGFLVPAPNGKVVNDIVIDYTETANILNAGERIDAVVDDGIYYAENSINYLRADSKEADASIRQFQEFLRTNPTLFAGVHITSDNPEMYDAVLRLIKTSPFGNFKEDRIPFQDGFTGKSMNVDKIIVDKPFQLDGETLSILSIPGKTKVSITFIAGAVSSQATSLKRKQLRAEKGERKTTVSLTKKIHRGKHNTRMIRK